VFGCALARIIKQRTATKSRPRQKKSEDKPWFSVECKLSRQNNRKLRRKYKKNRTEKNKEEINKSEKYYKRTPIFEYIL
jgi:hypothetical protein